jgi:hypothetical protein
MAIDACRALVFVVGAACLSVGGLADALAADEPRGQRVKIGFDIAASQGIKLDTDVPSQGLGSYLVTASSCNDCHTQPNYAPTGNPYIRQPKQVNLPTYLAGGRQFPTPTGTFCSRNITPAPGTHKPAGLTREQFIYVIRTGCDPQDENFDDPKTCSLLQVMPWPNFGTTYRRFELSAIYDYLSALPHTNIDSSAQCTPDPQGVAGNQ